MRLGTRRIFGGIARERATPPSATKDKLSHLQHKKQEATETDSLLSFPNSRLLLLLQIFDMLKHLVGHSHHLEVHTQAEVSTDNATHNASYDKGRACLWFGV